MTDRRGTVLDVLMRAHDNHPDDHGELADELLAALEKPTAVGKPARLYAGKGRRSSMWPVTAETDRDTGAVTLRTWTDGALDAQVCTGEVVIPPGYVIEVVRAVLADVGSAWTRPDQLEDEEP